MKKKYFITVIILVLLVTLISCILWIQYHKNHSIIVSANTLNNPDYFQFLAQLIKCDYQIVRPEQKIQDKILANWLPRLDIKREWREYITVDPGILNIQTYYLVVDLTSDLVRIDNTQKKMLFKQIKTGYLQNIYLLDEQHLNINKRLLINNHDAKPVNFYLIDFIKIVHPDQRLLKVVKNYTSNNPVQTDPLLILGFAGDVVLEEYVKYSLKTKGKAATFFEIVPLMETADFFSINLEFSISNRGIKENKHYQFRANESEFEVIAESPVDFVCIANNHIKDYGDLALQDTIEILKKYQLKFAGAGNNKEQAFRPALLTLQNNLLAYFSICKVPLENSGYDTMKLFTATETIAGVADDDLKMLKKLFKEQNERIIIIQPHTGAEHSPKPLAFHQRLARNLIDAGAAAVICHHPHVINGVEIYKNKLIAYSLGDFLFDIQRTNADEGIILYLYVKDQQIKSWSFYPTVSHYGQVILDEERISEVEKRFIKLTAELH